MDMPQGINGRINGGLCIRSAAQAFTFYEQGLLFRTGSCRLGAGATMSSTANISALKAAPTAQTEARMWP